MRCPICEYPGARPHYLMRDRFFEVSEDLHQLNLCPSCGLLFQSKEGLEQNLSDFYPPGYWWHRDNGRLSSWEQRYREWMVRNDQLRFVLSRFPDPAGRRLLDIGCGGGLFVREAVKAGFDAYGLENSPEALGIAEQTVSGRVLCCDVRDLHTSGYQFEVVTMFHVLEHLLDPLQFLKAVQRIVKRPGVVFLQVPNVDSYQARLLGPRWYGLDCPRHVYNFSTFSILHLLGKAGYRVHRVRHFSLRDNAAALVSSVFPWLDPMSQRVKHYRSATKTSSPWLTVRRLLYLDLLLMSQPLAFLEARMGHGATVSIYAGLD